MDALNELIKLVTKKRVKKVELFDENSRNKSSNYFKLFDGIHTRRYQSDTDAARDIYQCDPSEKKYLILKTRLKQKLLNTLFFLDFEDDENVPAYKNALYDCNKALYCAKVLLMNGSRRIAIPSVEKTLRKAQEYHLTDIELECTRILRAYYSTSNQYKEFVIYRDLAEQIEQRLLVENLSEKYYQEIVATYAKSKANRPRVRKLTEKHLKVLAEEVGKHESTKLVMNYYRIKSLFHQFSDDFQSAIAVTEQMEAYVVQSPHFHPRTRPEELAIQKMNFYVHLKSYEDGELHARKSLESIKAGSPNWFHFQEYHFLLAMHTGNYLRAAETFRDVLEQSNFRTLSEVKKERWKTFQAYLHYLYKTKKIRDIRPIIQNAKTGFKLNDYLDGVPAFDKQRRGLNISILTIQTLYYLERFDLDPIRQRVKAIKKYCRRYPKKDINFRSECFITLLSNVVEEDFRFYQTRKSSEKAYEEMTSVMIEYHGGNRALEVLPYEVMWELMLDKLKSYKYG
ncbi:MAG: hypothetical protein H7Z75_16425 [Ferruginibacter sp.]|nr:hypothetical protein [Cytophagales bacterium]